MDVGKEFDQWVEQAEMNRWRRDILNQLCNYYVVYHHQ